MFQQLKMDTSKHQPQITKMHRNKARKDLRYEAVYEFQYLHEIQIGCQ